jgi:L-ascorbate metabolism protein UlaG (beta-lactamase superfamily)
MLPQRALLSDPELLARFVPHAGAVLVGHTHFDHAVDVPALARRDGCKVYGSHSLRTLMGLYGLAEQSVAVEPGRIYEIGPFEVTFVESLHSKLTLGLAVPAGGELTCDHLDDLSAGRYRSGQVFGIRIAVAGVTFYHQGSANLIDERVVHRGVDYFLAGIAGRGFTPRYAERILSRLEPRIVIPQHFDDFFRPLEKELGFSLNVNLGGFVEEVRRVSSDFSVRTLRPANAVSRA